MPVPFMCLNFCSHKSIFVHVRVVSRLISGRLELAAVHGAADLVVMGSQLASPWHGRLVVFGCDSACLAHAHTFATFATASCGQPTSQHAYRKEEARVRGEPRREQEGCRTGACGAAASCRGSQEEPGCSTLDLKNWRLHHTRRRSCPLRRIRAGGRPKTV
eukprot:3085469-Pleurochrysis_carterae.AAC.1